MALEVMRKNVKRVKINNATGDNLWGSLPPTPLRSAMSRSA
jgi:hypothetical protein